MQIYSDKSYPITKRIIQLLDYKCVSKYKFSKDLGFSTGFLDKPREIGTDKYANILTYFPDVNPTWLLTGEGEMIISNKSEAKIYDEGIPLVSVEAVAGFNNGSFVIQESDIFARYVIPEFKKKGVDFLISIHGNSMAPRFNNSDIVACSIINHHRYIEWNEVHVIATADRGILCKRLRKSEKENHLLAVSDNIDYEPFDIPFSDISSVALVKGGVVFD